MIGPCGSDRAVGALESNPFYADGAALAAPMREMGSFVSGSDRAVAYAERGGRLLRQPL